MNDESAYADMVKRLIEQQSTQVVSNGIVEHSIVLIRELIKHAKSTVRIFCNQLNHRVYNDIGVVNAVKEALVRNVQIKVLIQQPIPDQQSKPLVDILRGSIHSVCSCGEAAKLPFNFCIADEAMYRMEPDRTQPNAFACMNASEDETIKSLTRLFDELFAISNPVHLQQEDHPIATEEAATIVHVPGWRVKPG